MNWTELVLILSYTASTAARPHTHTPGHVKYLFIANPKSDWAPPQTKKNPAWGGTNLEVSTMAFHMSKKRYICEEYH